MMTGSPGATTVGTVLGTAAYMSPEQARGEPVDARTDVFSFGAVLMKWPTGKQAFAGQTLATLFDQILNRDPQPLTAIDPDAPGELGRIIGKALEKDRELRYRSAADVSADLKQLRRDVAASAATPASSAQPAAAATAPRSRQPLIAAAAVAALVIVAAGFYVWRPGAGSTSPSMTPFEKLQVTQLTSTGNAFRPVVSPDGKYVVYLQTERPVRACGCARLHLRRLHRRGRSLADPVSRRSAEADRRSGEHACGVADRPWPRVLRGGRRHARIPGGW